MDTVYIYSLISMGGLGALLAAGLGFASRAFHVERDKRIDQVEEVLPSANCGACGYAGCSSFAEAVVTGDADIMGCPVGGEEIAGKIADILGQEAGSSEKVVAQILCQGGNKETQKRLEYRGIARCEAVEAIDAGGKTCQYGCLGYGDCVQVCPFDALEMNDNGLPEVDLDKCTGCGQCVEVCPRNIITLAPTAASTHIRCSSHEKGKIVRKICEVGCIACGLCAKNCPVEAITMEDNLAVIDYGKCIDCGICAEKCPTGTIEFTGQKIKSVTITDDCIGCTLCSKACPVEAISGEVKEKHEIDQEQCIKCGVCYQACNVDAIEVNY